MYACNGILLITNHRRGETRDAKDHPRLARIDAGLDQCLYMGNLDSLRDWGHATTWRCSGACCARKPRRLCLPPVDKKPCGAGELAAAELGWAGNSTNQSLGRAKGSKTGRRKDTGEVVVRIDPRYFRPLKWKPCWAIPPRHAKAGVDSDNNTEELVTEMVTADKEEAAKEATLRREGFA